MTKIHRSNLENHLMHMKYANSDDEKWFFEKKINSLMWIEHINKSLTISYRQMLYKRDRIGNAVVIIFKEKDYVFIRMNEGIAVKGNNWEDYNSRVFFGYWTTQPKAGFENCFIAISWFDV